MSQFATGSKLKTIRYSILKRKAVESVAEVIWNDETKYSPFSCSREEIVLGLGRHGPPVRLSVINGDVRTVSIVKIAMCFENGPHHLLKRRGVTWTLFGGYNQPIAKIKIL